MKVKIIAMIIAPAVWLLAVKGTALASSPPSPPTFVCLGGSVCTGGTTTIGTGSKKVTVPKLPTKASTQKLTETQILDLVDIFRQLLITVKTLFHIYGETLPFYVTKALLCPTSPTSAELRCFQNSGFPQAPVKG